MENLERLEKLVDEFEQRWGNYNDYRFEVGGHRDRELLYMVKTLLAYLKEKP